MTWLAIETDAAPERDVVFGLMPRTWEAFAELLAQTWAATDPELLDLCRLRLAQMMGCQHELDGLDAAFLRDLEDWPDAPGFSDRDRAALDYAEQFHIDQNRLTDEQKSALADHLTYEGLVTFASALQVRNAYLRMLTVLDVAADPRAQLARPDATALERDASAEPPDAKPSFPFPERLMQFESTVDPWLQAARWEFTRVMNGESRLDMQTLELCRLFNATHQSCALCMSGRQETDMPEGVDDLMDIVVRWESADLPARQQAALRRVTEAFVIRPGGLSPAQHAEASALLTPGQVVELLLKLSSYSYNKTTKRRRSGSPTPSTKTASPYSAVRTVTACGRSGARDRG